MICINKFPLFFSFLTLLAGGAMADDAIKDWETNWDKELSPFQGLSLSESLELAKTRLNLKVIVEDRANPPSDEKETQDFYSAYFRSQRFRPYTAMLILPDQKLPGDFKNRPLEKETLLIVNANTTKESFLHLVLHLVTDKKESQEYAQKIQNLRKEKSSENTTREIRELQLKILILDSEAEKDLFILAKQKDFGVSDKEKAILVGRIERNIQRLETELKPQISEKDKNNEQVQKAQEKINNLKTRLTKVKS